MVPSRQGPRAAPLPCGLLLLATCVSLCQSQEPRVKPADCDRREHPVLSYRGESSISMNSTMSDQLCPHRSVLPRLFSTSVFSVEAMGVRVLPPGSEGFLPAGPGPGRRPNPRGGEVGFVLRICPPPAPLRRKKSKQNRFITKNLSLFSFLGTFCSG